MAAARAPSPAIFALLGFSCSHIIHRTSPATGIMNPRTAQRKLPSSSERSDFRGACWTPHLGQNTASSSMTSPHFLQYAI